MSRALCSLNRSRGAEFRAYRPAAVVLIAIFAATLCFGVAASAVVQTQAPPPQGTASPPPPTGGVYERLNSSQLQRLVAPIALYPDQMVAQILAAATFPTQIVEANQWLAAHPGLQPADLGNQVNQQPWDPSVKALVQYPDVLNSLSSNLGWTSELGDAYYNQGEAVMKAVQEMRKKARKAGTLQSNAQLAVTDQGGQVVIEPVNPDIVYVPAYDPWICYGDPLAPWPDWIEVPGIWWAGPGLYFGVGFPIAPFFGFGWGWGFWGFDWGHHWLMFNHERFVAHSPVFYNRGGYFAGRGDFGRPGAARPGMPPRDTYRGYEAPRNSGGTRTGPFSGFGNGGTTRGFSARGQMSFGGMRGNFGGGFHGGGGGRR
jgi:Protein of unknown function (DUF3300)